MKHALVTGSSGYVGSVLVRHLLSSGYIVTGIDLIPGAFQGQINEICCDVRNIEQLKSAMSTVEIVFHNAASVPLAMNSSLGVTNNEEMCRAILDCLLELEPKKLVFVSSSAVYGHPKRLPVDENSPLAPFDSYGLAKAKCEMMCREPKYESLDITIIRPRTVLGENRSGLMSVLFSIVQSGLPLFVPHGRSSRYQLIHVDDLATGMILAGEQRGSNSFNFGGSESQPMVNLLRDFATGIQSKSRVVGINRGVFVALLTIMRLSRLVPFTRYQIQMFGSELWFDTTKARKELGWEPKWSDLEMLKQSYDSFVSQKTKAGKAESIHSKPLRSRLLELIISANKKIRR